MCRSPGTPMTLIVVASFLLSTALVPISGAYGAMRDPVDHFTINLRSGPRDPLAGTSLFDLDMDIVLEGEALLGLSSGDLYELVIDPTPRSPELPWVATMVLVRGDIFDVHMMSSVSTPILSYPEVRTVPRPTSPWVNEEPWGIWNGVGSYPDRQVMVESLGYKRVDGELLHAYSIWITPFHLEGASLTCNDDLEVEVEYTDQMSGPTPTRISGDPVSVPGTLSICNVLEVHPQYMIITRKDTADELGVLAQWRNGMGIATSVIAVEDIYEHYEGSDDPADLVRDYIKDVLDEWGTLEHVMLAGDWDTVPTKRVVDSEAFAGWDDGYIPADTYFQCLDGTWDLDGDGSYSEPGDMEDIIPDLSVSRLAINDPIVWMNKIAQLIAYETGDQGKDWASTALLVAANTHNYGDGSIQSEYLWEKYLNATYSGKLPLYEDKGTLTLAAVDQAIESGATFVQFVDHGGPTVWCDDYGAGVVYRDRDARELTNSNMMPVISTLACLTNWFDDTSGCQNQRFSEGLGEAFTENVNGGALGYIGSSRTSVGILGANRYLPYDNGLQEDIARQVGGLYEFTMGTAFTDGKEHYAEVWGQQFPGGNTEVAMCWLEFTLLGEPVVEMWTDSFGGMQLEVHHENDLDPHIQVLVTDEGLDPVIGANVTLENFERGVYSRAVTDGSGAAVFDLELDWFCDINLTVTSHNFDQVRDHIRISDIIPPVTTVITDPHDPDGKNGWFLREPIISLVPNEDAVVHYRLGPSRTGILNRSCNYTLPALGDGIHNVHFFSEDEAANIEDERHAEFRIDIKDPNLTVSLSPEKPDGENGWYGTEPLLTIEPSEDDEGSPVMVRYTIEGIENDYDGPIFVPEGIHQVRIFGEDLSGRRSADILLELKVDTTPPSTEMALSTVPDGKNGWYISSPEAELVSGEEGARVQYRLSNREAFREYIGPFRIGDGSHLLQYRSVDLSGNIGTTGSYPIKVDTGPPSVECSVLPAEPDGLKGSYVTAPELRMSWYDNIGCTLHFSMDGTEGKTDITRFDVPDGSHEIMVYAEDEAGNTCLVQRFQLNVDTETPSTILNVREPGPFGWYTSSPLIELVTDTDAEIVYWWEGREERNTYDKPIDIPSREGVLVLHYHSVDTAGNEESECTHQFKLDTRDPLLRMDIIQQERGRFLIDCTGSSDGTDIQYRVLNGDSVLVEWTSDGILEVGLSGGVHILKVEARDMAGNTVSTEVELEVEPAWVPLVTIGAIVLVLSVAAVTALVFIVRGKGRRRGMDRPLDVETVMEAIELVK
ncbi:MAG: hypothetical protein JXA22_05380 [Candidatus Thermoplasmatota archaeon]|nr:hypothetical protein [Candidatus Thermoplasmatota archaeon]